MGNAISLKSEWTPIRTEESTLPEFAPRCELQQGGWTSGGAF
jgi:hypothetical protein